MITDPKGEGKSLAVVRPKYYSVANAEAATGLTYRYLRDQARALGVRILKLSGGRRLLIDADDFDLKVQQLAGEPVVQPEPEPEQDQEAAAFRRMGWLVRK